MAMQYRTSVDVDNLFSTSVIPVLTDYLSIAADQTLKRGALIDETGKLCTATSEVFAVLADDIDTTGAAKEAAVYLTGEFNEKALSVATGATVAGLKKSARKVSIYIKPTM
ncbi:MAG: hypothetical protein J6V64_02700 [Burkholderiaceae bacterium]|nr:hypothetical protein [Burkholderiaceae bacterium]